MKQYTFLLKTLFSLALVFLMSNINAQNVGIGTSTPHPNAMLEISGINKGLLLPRGNANSRNIVLQSNTARGLMMFDTTTGTVWIHNGNGTVQGWREMQDDKSGLWIKSGTDITSNNLPNGNVTIGLANTQSRLEILGNATTNPVLKAVTGYVGAADIRAIEGRSLPITGYGIGGYFEGGYHGLRVVGNPGGGTGTCFGMNLSVSNTVSSTKYGTQVNITGPGSNYGMYLNASGGQNNYSIYAPGGNAYIRDSMWIGKTTGEARLDIAGGNGNLQISEGDIRMGTSTNMLKMGVYTSGGLAGQATMHASGTNPKLIFGNNNVDIMAISPVNNGTVVIGNGAGVGQYANGYKLNVHGKIVCTEVMVKTVATWPDYVFDEEYVLPALQEVKAFIKKNKHLPGVPSAAEVEKEGLILGEMQNKLLKKVEELTLYILNQDERLNRQEAEIKQLKRLSKNK